MKKIIILLSIAIISTLSSFQEEQTINLKLTIPQAETVLKALSKLPYEESAQLISIIQAQAQKQISDTTKHK